MTSPHPRKLTARFKKWLAYSRYSQKIDLFNRLPLLKQWADGQTFDYFESKFQLYDSINALITTPITYLEFGVFEGTTINYWSNLNRHPFSRFVGFDTFTGLPEDWQVYVGKVERGHFSTYGKTPATTDPRVSFVAGLFQDTLPEFLKGFHMPTGHQLIVHNDADLYSSTMFTLCSLHPFMAPGTILIFDDFSHMLDEFRALADYAGSYRRDYEIIGAAGEYYDRVAIRLGHGLKARPSVT